MQKYGLIGYPLKHSFSIGYFNEKFKAENIDAEYVNFEIPRIEDFMEVIEENPNLCGLTRSKSSPTWTNWTKTRPR